MEQSGGGSIIVAICIYLFIWPKQALKHKYITTLSREENLEKCQDKQNEDNKRIYMYKYIYPTRDINGKGHFLLPLISLRYDIVIVDVFSCSILKTDDKHD